MSTIHNATEVSRPYSFEDFAAAAKKHLFAFALRLTQNYDDAEDLLQDAVMKAFRAYEADRDNKDAMKPSNAWFKQILFNCFLDARRKKSRRPQTCSLQSMQDDNPHFDAASADASPEQELMAYNLGESMTKALLLIPEDQRQLIIDSLNQEDHNVLAKQYGCHAVTMRTRLHKARRNLRRQLLQIDPAYARYRPEIEA